MTGSATVPAAASAGARVGPRAIVAMMFNPGAVLQRHMETLSWRSAMAVSGSAFALFFAQGALDMLRTGRIAWPTAALLTVVGILYGTAGICAVGLVAWILSRPFRSTHSLAWAVKAYALAYSPALVYGLVGMVVTLTLKWNTAVSFGATGVLWAIGPMMAVNEQLTGGKRGPAVFLSTLCGGVVLLGWAQFGVGR